MTCSQFIGNNGILHPRDSQEQIAGHPSVDELFGSFPCGSAFSLDYCSVYLHPVLPILTPSKKTKFSNPILTATNKKEGREEEVESKSLYTYL